MIVIKTEEFNKYINALLNKSEEAYLMSIEIINKPTINYRTEGFCFFICNAWELLLKAYFFLSWLYTFLELNQNTEKYHFTYYSYL